MFFDGQKNDFLAFVHESSIQVKAIQAPIIDLEILQTRFQLQKKRLSP